MNKKRNQYSSDFKAKVALSAIREEGSLSELSARYGVNPNMISRWKKQVLQGVSDIFSGKQEQLHISNDQQVKALHAKIGQLTVEKDFLEDVSRRLGLK